LERAKRFSQLAQECDRLAQLQTDPTVRDHYENIAVHYFALAEAELRLARERQERLRERARQRHADRPPSPGVVASVDPELPENPPPRKPRALSARRARKLRREIG
jgi:hypothetical protein